MRFTLSTGLGGIEDYPRIAAAAEAAGFTSLAVPDSLFYPEVTESEYPYLSTEAVRQALDGMPVLEPLIAMAGMAAMTSRLRFYPAVMKVPVRQPLVLAKALSSLAVMSNNRISLGAGLSPWKEDFSFNGVTWDDRGKRFDACLEIIRGAQSGGYFEYHDEYYDIGRCKLSPVSDLPIPILIGGHAKVALRRAARVGDGWISANSDYDSLAEMILHLQGFREEFGTASRKDFEIHAADNSARTPGDYERLAELGVTDACVMPWNPYDPALSCDKKIALIDRFGEQIIGQFGRG